MNRISFSGFKFSSLLSRYLSSRRICNTATIRYKMNGQGEHSILNSSLKESDPALYDLIKCEQRRQFKGLELIPSENFTSLAVLECLGSCLTNKYSEGLPGARYYGGNEFIDQIELLCQSRCLQAFNLNPNEWAVNVQPLSGSPANLAVYMALIGPHGRIMGLDLPDGGHLTHGFMTAKKKLSAASVFFESMPYKVDPSTGLIDYDQLEANAKLFKPQLIIAGTSGYSRRLDYARFQSICEQNDCFLMADMAHISGLVAAGVIPSPFQYCHVVTTTTHKTLRGPRAGVIFFRKDLKAKGEKWDFENKINGAVFPGLQGGPHNNAIAAIATAMLQTKSDSFVSYQRQVVTNAKQLGEELSKFGFNIVTGGTDTHLLLLDLRSFEVTGSKMEHVLELIGVACNKNTIPGDKSALNPSGIRIGTPALTTRGMMENDMGKVAEFVNEGVLLAQRAQAKSGPKLADFKAILETDETLKSIVAKLKRQVEDFASKFFMADTPLE